MRTQAVVMEGPQVAGLRGVSLSGPGRADVVVAVRWSGISAGTERLLWDGRMPSFPGMGYPLVPGYESVGEVVEAGPDSGRRAGEAVFVPGARCFGDLRGLFGGAAARLVVPGSRAHPLDAALGERGTLLALAATAHHALAGGPPPGIVVGHGVLGRLLARLALALGHPPPVVWEREPRRRDGARGYVVLAPEADAGGGHAAAVEASGDAAVLDALVPRLAHGGEVVLAGFYPGDVRFAFAPAFMREMRLRLAAEWQPADMLAVRGLVESGRLSLDGLVTHRLPAVEVARAYRTAFGDPDCLKMVLDWSGAHA